MVDTIKRYNVVLASPSDVAADREFVASVIEEINRLLAPQFIEFQVLRWESNVAPGIGNYPQEVINRQILNDYDLLIALFAARLGSPTPTAPSGTVEEVRHALAKTDSPFGGSRLVVFFKRVSVSVLECDIEQISALHEFRKELQTSNVLYSEYSSDNDLGQHLRSTLMKLAQSVNLSSSSNTSALLPFEDLLDEPGILDLMSFYESAISEAAIQLGEGSRILNEFNIQTNKYNEDIRASIGLSITHDKKKVINGFASIMERAASDITDKLSRSRSGFNQALDFALEAVNLQMTDIGVSEDDLGNLEKNLEELRLSANGAAVAWGEMRVAVNGLPWLTSHLNIAKRRMLSCVSELENLVDEINRRIDSLENRMKGIKTN